MKAKTTKTNVLAVKELTKEQLYSSNRQFKIDESCWWETNIEELRACKKLIVNLADGLLLV